MRVKYVPDVRNDLNFQTLKYERKNKLQGPINEYGQNFTFLADA